jgi:hypothetical protein
MRMSLNGDLFEKVVVPDPAERMVGAGVGYRPSSIGVIGIIPLLVDATGFVRSIGVCKSELHGVVISGTHGEVVAICEAGVVATGAVVVVFCGSAM